MLLLRKISDALDDPVERGPTRATGTQAAPGNVSTSAVPVAAAAAGHENNAAISGCGGSTCSEGAANWEMVPSSRPDPEELASEESPESEAIAAARVLRRAAVAAEALAPRLAEAEQRAAKAEALVEYLEAQQRRLTEAFLGEIRLRDVELAFLRRGVGLASDGGAASADSVEAQPQAHGQGKVQSPSQASAAPKAVAEAPVCEVMVASEQPGAGHSEEVSSSTVPDRVAAAVSTPLADAAFIEVLTFAEEGPLGFSFEEDEGRRKLVKVVDADTPASGRVVSGDELFSVAGTEARQMSQEALTEALEVRPLVVSFIRGEATRGDGSMANNGVGGARGLALRGRDLAGHLAGWTFAAAKAVGRELEAAILVDKEEDYSDPDAVPSEVRNRPFYELVRTSMMRECSGVQEEPAFEQWLRDFHNDRDDEWYANNHLRIYTAFRPHWDEVLAAQRALAAS
mmetsp:Transcript_39208/g.85690  ORF Transcript_39208/g.85690 Transcript_39208/m.85690 type:complete len:457 (-) Transcript_39208:72-1442(-)